MKLYFMREDAIAYFKKNVEVFAEFYFNEDNKWMYEKYVQFKGEEISPFVEFKLSVPEFKMDMSMENPEDSDFYNAKILYTALKDISHTQASDERFWTGLAHSELFWKYMQYRCGINSSEIKSSKITNRYFFTRGNKNNLIVHTLAKLWWVGRFIYNEKIENHFEGLEYFKKDFERKTLSLFSNEFSYNPKITRAILSSISGIENSGLYVGKREFYDIISYVNFLGGVMIIDYLSEDNLKNKIIKHYYEFNETYSHYGE